MSKVQYRRLKRHIGHKIAIVEYGTVNVTVECETCNEVLYSEDK